MYLTEIRAAISVGQRPTAMLLNDPYAGHRKWWNPDYRPTPALASVWTDWDFILLRVFQYLEDYTTQNGHPIWVEEDPDVYWEASISESGYEQAVHEYRENHEVKEWQSIRMKPMWNDDVETPSMEKWIKRLETEEAGGFDNRPTATGRPPTPEELAALRAPKPVE